MLVGVLSGLGGLGDLAALVFLGEEKGVASVSVTGAPRFVAAVHFVHHSGTSCRIWTRIAGEFQAKSLGYLSISKASSKSNVSISVNGSKKCHNILFWRVNAVSFTLDGGPALDS
ncbi:hypothetical protein EDB80DRAFT_736389 [Ilyonectria destructans]|nr:hypothetical protein EDB80DRAFT_736389 [Ilyonectria destructans]